MKKSLNLQKAKSLLIDGNKWTKKIVNSPTKIAKSPHTEKKNRQSTKKIAKLPKIAKTKYP